MGMSINNPPVIPNVSEEYIEEVSVSGNPNILDVDLVSYNYSYLRVVGYLVRAGVASGSIEVSFTDLTTTATLVGMKHEVKNSVSTVSTIKRVGTTTTIGDLVTDAMRFDLKVYRIGQFGAYYPIEFDYWNDSDQVATNYWSTIKGMATLNELDYLRLDLPVGGTFHSLSKLYYYGSNYIH